MLDGDTDMNTKRRPIIAGNWKMNKTPSEARTLLRELIPLVTDMTSSVDVVVCPPAIDIPAVHEMTCGTPIALGAQNVHFKDSGAFTGEISAPQLKELKVSHVIVGHSERRTMFNDTDETVNLRARAALAHDLVPIICVGETEAERVEGSTAAVLTRQTKAAFFEMSREDALRCVIAYEPIWAIGTGRTATPEDANATIAIIRETIASIYDADAADTIRILYGGSMNAKNSDALMSMPNIDGGLIGGASLKAEDFASIVTAAHSHA